MHDNNETTVESTNIYFGKTCPDNVLLSKIIECIIIIN